MNTSFDDKKPFITLLAYANHKALPLNLMNLIDSVLMLSNSEQETSSLLTKKLFNLIILDMALSGLRLAKLAKSGDCINCHTPLIALVEKDDSEERTHLIASGFDDCLLKPLTPYVLNEFIALWQNDDALAAYLESAQTLLKIFKGNKDVILTLYTKLFEELPEQIDLISIALTKKQYDVAFNATHKINASTKICYLKGIEEIAKALEDCLIQTNHEHAQGYFSMLQHSVDALISHRLLILDHINKAATVK